MALAHLHSIVHQTPLHSRHRCPPHRTAFFISAYDQSTRKHHLYSAAHEGGPVTHLMTLYDPRVTDFTEAQHLYGLVFFTSIDIHSDNSDSKYNFILNPSTHKIFKLPDQPKCTYTYRNLCYFFGFDESRNEHKIFNIREREPTGIEIMIFSMSSYSWRTIDAEPPIGFTWDSHTLYVGCDLGVCVNSVVHLILSESFDILAFDLRTEKFLVVNPPQAVVPHARSTMYNRNCKPLFKNNNPLIIKINGCLGVVCHDLVVETNEMHIWILQDYENRVWVRETITFPQPWIELGKPFPVDSVNMDEIILSSLDHGMFSDKVLGVAVYNRKSRCFKSLQFTPGHRFPFSGTLNFYQIRCYFESMVPLKEQDKTC